MSEKKKPSAKTLVEVEKYMSTLNGVLERTIDELNAAFGSNVAREDQMPRMFKAWAGADIALKVMVEIEAQR